MDLRGDNSVAPVKRLSAVQGLGLLALGLLLARVIFEIVMAWLEQGPEGILACEVLRRAVGATLCVAIVYLVAVMGHYALLKAFGHSRSRD